jgi:hypothetical protein
MIHHSLEWYHEAFTLFYLEMNINRKNYFMNPYNIHRILIGHLAIKTGFDFRLLYKITCNWKPGIPNNYR